MKNSLILSGLLPIVSLCLAPLLLGRRVNALEQDAKRRSEAKKCTAVSYGEIKASPPQIAPGRIVHFLLPDGQHRPAIITEDLAGRAIGLDPVGLTVVLSLSDKATVADGFPLMQKFPVHHDPSAQKPGTWHWPERT